jgi:hypothetical protein
VLAEGKSAERKELTIKQTVIISLLAEGTIVRGKKEISFKANRNNSILFLE